MKWLLTFTAVLALALSGCGRSDPAVEKDAKSDQPSSPPVSQTPVAFTPETHSVISSDEVPLLEQINRENVRVVTAALPSMVRIIATPATDPRMKLFGNDLPFKFPFSPGNPHGMPQSEPAFGSGVVLSRDGYIVTNNHVIEGAKDIDVQLQDKRIFSARVVAFDVPVDVAVLKIQAKDLSPIPWGDSDKVRVGEQVFAIGDPFDFDDSVSKGIVSAKGRNLPDSTNYEDYIQTDAAINPGNSGGALINIRGELIGINAAIASTSRVSMGVGFAIPSNLVRYAVEGLLKQGKLVRGYLGVRFPESIDEGVLAQLGLHTDNGALLAGVQRPSPADRAGLHSGDFITELDGHKIGSVGDLRLIVAQIPIGKDVKVVYIRGGTVQSTTVKIAESPANVGSDQNPGPDNESSGQPSPSPIDNPQGIENVLSGVQVTDLNDKSRQKFRIDSMVAAGVIVSAVKEGSLADAKGITAGDVIESASINRGSTEQIPAANDFAVLTKKLKPDQSAVLLVHHGKDSSFIYLAPEK